MKFWYRDISKYRQYRPALDKTTGFAERYFGTVDLGTGSPTTTAGTRAEDDSQGRRVTGLTSYTSDVYGRTSPSGDVSLS